MSNTTEELARETLAILHGAVMGVVIGVASVALYFVCVVTGLDRRVARWWSRFRYWRWHRKCDHAHGRCIQEPWATPDNESWPVASPPRQTIRRRAPPRQPSTDDPCIFCNGTEHYRKLLNGNIDECIFGEAGLLGGAP